MGAHHTLMLSALLDAAPEAMFERAGGGAVCSAARIEQDVAQA